MSVAYSRASSTEDLGTQRALIKGAARTRNYKITDWYVERCPAKTRARPALTRLRRDVRAHRISKLSISSLDRIGRTEAELFAVLKELRSAGATLVVAADKVTIGPARNGKKNTASEVLALMNALERQRERTRLAERIAMSRALRAANMQRKARAKKA